MSILRGSFQFVVLFFCTHAFANFNCNHQFADGTKYLVEYKEGSLCLKYEYAEGEYEKIDLFLTFDYEDQGQVLIYNDDKNFALRVPQVPLSKAVNTDIQHTAEDGVSVESAKTLCEPL